MWRIDTGERREDDECPATKKAVTTQEPFLSLTLCKHTHTTHTHTLEKKKGESGTRKGMGFGSLGRGVWHSKPHKEPSGWREARRNKKEMWVGGLEDEGMFAIPT